MRRYMNEFRIKVGRTGIRRGMGAVRDTKVGRMGIITILRGMGILSDMAIHRDMAMHRDPMVIHRVDNI